MRILSPTVGRSLLSVLLALSTATAAACSDGGQAGGEGGSGAASMQPVAASKLEAELAAAGVDTENIPAWEPLFESWIAKAAEEPMGTYNAAKPVMELFKRSLGRECEECHSGANHAVPEPVKHLVAGMWNQWVRGLRLKDGVFVFCDSCHQGKDTFLERGDKDALSSWMQDNFVAKFARVDGAAQSCASCHGEPFNGDFLSVWAEGK
jgi:hypothetical protein